ncbi:phospholipase A2 inhibitor and Ly6/PLAUR domain-containing protein-like [Rhinatrema bivittatum]|uniref:phospholipase A2 inhibitor and Ly6/PLAUR domain-containing protein-like n=1 Tax=Rhinatrema bivittatum TaxID=194408 RepID=UPI001127E46D|nr:phospholipase A2 inhibitor and Ly6/PLAUR domain-containing protein-like [Rhinatrema bivittatum]
MRASLISICIFSALIVTGLSLNCHKCLNTTGVECSPISETCNEGEMCMTRLENNTVGNDVHMSIKKGCKKYDPFLCTTQICLNGGNFSYDAFSLCCDEDNCNSGPVTMPERNTTLNGLQCPSCYVEGSSKCTKEETINCTGNQGQCGELDGEVRRPDQPFKNVAWKVCVTTGACERNFNLTVATTAMKGVHSSCI